MKKQQYSIITGFKVTPMSGGGFLVKTKFIDVEPHFDGEKTVLVVVSEEKDDQEIVQAHATNIFGGLGD